MEGSSYRVRAQVRIDCSETTGEVHPKRYEGDRPIIAIEELLGDRIEGLWDRIEEPLTEGFQPYSSGGEHHVDFW